MAERERQEALDKLADIDVHRNSFYFSLRSRILVTVVDPIKKHGIF